MAKGKLQQKVDEYRDQLKNHEKQAEASLNTAYAHVLHVVQPQIDALYQMINEKQQAGEDIPPSWLYEAGRLSTIEDLLTKKINQFGVISRDTTRSLMREMTSLGAQSAQQIMAQTVPAGYKYSFGIPSQKAMEDLVAASQPGSPLDDLFQGFGNQAASDVKKALIVGLSLGDNPRQIAPQIQTALDIPRQRAVVISRNEMIRAYRSSQTANYQANKDVISGWVWAADLSARTCAVCIAMNGSVHDVSEEMETHVQCRCTQIPQTKSWSAILGIDGLNEDDDEDIPDGSDWFDNQDEKTQRTILGNAKYEAWSAGQFTLKDLVGKSHSDDWGGSLYEKSLKEVTS